MSRVTYREAIRQALKTALHTDARVFLMGEDVARYGGAYAVSKGLVDEFGEERVRDTPLSESAFVGAGIGAAIGGMRPIVEVMSVNFSLLAMDQIVNNAATLSHMSGGQFSVPLVIRMSTGAGLQLAAQHSHSFEAWYAHVPGLKVLAPATVQDAYDMPLAALRERDPVLIFEHVLLYAMEGELDLRPGGNPFRAEVRRPGTDLSLITFGGCVPKALQAAEVLASSGLNVEVLDLRALRPLDGESILASVRKTHRALLVEEGWKSGGFAAELMARILEEAFYELDAPPARVCSREVPVPYARQLQDTTIPQVEDIVAAAKKVLGHV